MLKARAEEKEGQPYCSCLHKATTTITGADDNNKDGIEPVEPISLSRVRTNHSNEA